MIILKALSIERICMSGRSATLSAAGVHDVMEETMRGARAGRDLHSNGRLWKIGWRIAGSLHHQHDKSIKYSPRRVHLRNKLCP